jgi:flagellar biosynthesis anti-sigma factor FlgM
MSNIDKLVGGNVANTYQTQSAAPTSANATQAGGKVHHGHRQHQAAQADSVTLSDGARALASAREAVKAAPDVRQEKVSAIKQSVADGTYQVNSSVLARRMLNQSRVASQ